MATLKELIELSRKNGQQPDGQRLEERLAHFLVQEISPIDLERDRAYFEKRLAMLIDQGVGVIDAQSKKELGKKENNEVKEEVKKPAKQDFDRIASEAQRLSDQKENKKPEKKLAGQLKVGENNLFKFGGLSQASAEHPDYNEDSLCVIPEVGLVAVFDGLTSENHQRLAARMSADYLRNWVQNNKKTKEFSPRDLEGLVKEIDKHLREKAGEAQYRTTITLGAVSKNAEGGCKVSYCNVGDSRMLVLRKANSRIEYTSFDDGLLKLLLMPTGQRPAWVEGLLERYQLPKNLQLSPQEAASFAEILDTKSNPAEEDETSAMLFAERSIVGQVIGAGTITPTIGEKYLEAGDRLLLATDGIFDNLTRQEIVDLAKIEKLEEAAETMVARAREVAGSSRPRAKEDDITSLIIEVK